ncbi:hypothetical protein Agub_g6827, partial [Astrephomene gubernaculifera]
MSEGATQVVRSLFVTLRRGYAGTPWFHRRILEALGLKHRHQCIEKPNNSSIRGMLAKVPHLIIVETDRMRYLRALKEYHEQAPREPWILTHSLPQQQSQPSSQQQLPAGSAALPLPPPPAPRLTPFAAQQLQEHVHATGLEGYEASAQPQQAPRKYFLERAKRWRVKVLTERGLFGADACKEHAEAIRPKAYRRRIGIR